MVKTLYMQENFLTLRFQDVHLEREVLSRLAYESSLISEVYGILEENDFTDPTLVELYQTIKKFHSEKKTWDPLILRASLQIPSKADFLFSTFPSSIGLSEFRAIAEKMKEYSIKREIQQRLKETENNLFSIDIGTLSTSMMQFFSSLSLTTDRKKEAMSELISKHSEMMDKRISGELSGISTGFPDLDFSLGQGLQRKDLIVIGARPSVGKTSFSLTLAYNAARKNYKALFITLEMDDQEVLDRLISFETKIPLTSIIRGKVKKEVIEQAYNSISLLPLSIMYIPKGTSGDVYSIASRHKYTKGLDLLVVDYLGYLSDEGENETHRLGKISKNLKTISSLLDCAVVAPHQLNRKVEQRSEKTRDLPLLSDLRDSGHIEQDADVVMFLNRDQLGSNATKTILRIAKNRTGETKVFDLKFDPLTTRFHQ